MMRKWIRVALFVLAGLIIAIQFVRPARTNPVTPPAQSLAQQLHLPGDVAALLDRGCRDCHSNDTRWPWYSNVAPISWFVIDHVDHGRSHFNYSEWASYDAEEATKLLKDSCQLAQKHAMPLDSYLLLHGSARLSAADIALLCAWTQQASAEVANAR